MDNTTKEQLTGDLNDSNTGEFLRKATEEEIEQSLEAGPEGHIDVDGRTCYVD